MDKELYNIKYVIYPFGLINNSVLCYFNSLLQSLLSCSILNKYLLKNKKKFEKNEMAKIYIELIEENILKKEYNENKQKIENKGILILNELFKKNKNFAYSQQDSGEALYLLIDMFNDKYIEKLFNYTYKCDLLCLECKKQKTISNDISNIFNIPVDDINLKEKILKKNQNEKITEANMLNKYLSGHLSYLEDYNCENCNKKKIKGCYLYRLSSIPEIIVIILNKYLKKSLFYFPYNLNFENNKYKYQLISQIEHSGHMNNGHYINYSKRKNNKVYLFNDIHVEEANFNITPNSYILFYEMIKRPE